MSVRFALGAILLVAVAFGVALLIDQTTDLSVAYVIPAAVAGGAIIGSLSKVRHRAH